MQGIIGEDVDLSLDTSGRYAPIHAAISHLTKRLLYTKWRDPGEEPKLHLFGQLKRITKQWLDDCLVCKGGTYPAQLMYQELADMACERITAGITRSLMGERPIKAVLDPYNPTGSTIHVNFNTSKNRPLADRCPPMPYQLGDSGQRLGSRVLPGGRIPSQGQSLCQKPQPRAWKSHTAMAPKSATICPISLSWWTMVRTRSAAPDRRDQGISRVKMPRKRNPPWKPTGSPA